MEKIASDILKLAKEVVAYDPKFKYGLTEEQWDDLEKGLRNDWKKTISTLKRQRGPIVTTAKIGNPNRSKDFRISYDGMTIYDYSKNLDKIPDLNKLQDSKIKVEQFSMPESPLMLGSRLKGEKIELDRVLKKHTSADKREVHANMIAPLIREVGEEMGRGVSAEFPVVVQFEEGFSIKSKIKARIGFRYDGLDVVAQWVLDFNFPYQLEKEVKKNKAVIAKVKEMFKADVAKLLGDKLRNQSPKAKAALFSKYAPDTYNEILAEGGNPAEAYDYAISYKSGDFEIGEGSELIDEERHWATYQSYSAVLNIKPAKSNSLADLLSDSRFNVERVEGDTYEVEI
jgi:hypothetical protein